MDAVVTKDGPKGTGLLHLHTLDTAHIAFLHPGGIARNLHRLLQQKHRLGIAQILLPILLRGGKQMPAVLWHMDCDSARIQQDFFIRLHTPHALWGSRLPGQHLDLLPQKRRVRGMRHPFHGSVRPIRGNAGLHGNLLPLAVPADILRVRGTFSLFPHRPECGIAGCRRP